MDDCARILCDAETRKMYDQKLADFKLAEPRLVSSTGVAIIDPTRFRIDLDYLIGNEPMSLEMVVGQARLMSGFDDKRLEKARKRAKKKPEDLQDRDALRDELTKNLTFLSITEDFLWQAAGVSGALDGQDHSRAQDGAHFTQALDLRIDQIQEQASLDVASRHEMASLGMAPRLLLEGPSAAASSNALLVAELSAKVVESIHARANPLREAVAQKAAVIDELASISRWAWLGTKRFGPVLDIVMITSSAEYDEHWPGPDFSPAGFLIRIDTLTGAASPVIEKPSPKDLASWPNAVAVLEANPEIPGFFVEAFALANKLQELVEAHEPLEQQLAAPGPKPSTTGP